MRNFIFIIYFIVIQIYAQEKNAFKTIQTNENYLFNEFVDAFSFNNNQIYISSPINVTEDNYRINGLNLTYQSININDIKHFKITVYTNSIENGKSLPKEIIFQEVIHSKNYYCNQKTVDLNTVNIDFFLQNPIVLSRGKYWFTILAITNTTPNNQIKIKTVKNLDYTSSLWNGNEWKTNTIDIAHKLYGTVNAEETIENYPYIQSFGGEELDSWQMTDLFPDGILGFKVTSEIYSESDANQSSIKISADYGNQVDSQLFYNLTSPKFKFKANNTYKVSVKIHHAVFNSGYRNAFIGLVSVPDPPKLGHLQALSNNTTGNFHSENNLDPKKANSYFKKITYNYKPITDIETRIGIHMELGDITFGETADVWFDEFKIENTTNTLSLDKYNNNSIQIYPNPTKNNIRINTIEKIKLISITNLLGKMILQTKKRKINLTTLKNGIYFIRVKTNTRTFVQKIVKLN